MYRRLILFGPIRTFAFSRCFLFARIVFSKVSSPSLLQFFFENAVTIIREQYSLNCYRPTYVISSLSSLLNVMLHYRYIVTALKIIIYNNTACFCLQTPVVYLELNII